jgi:cytochrome c-type biogenesis protein CcmH
MMLWLTLALMTVAALGAAVWPLVRARGTTAAGSDLAVYRDQLEEIERDRTDARIGADEAEAARVEVSRRLLAAANKESATPADPARTAWRRNAAVFAAVVVIPLVGAVLYGRYGSPDLPGQPLASRPQSSEVAEGTIGQLIARVEAHLRENPNDARGWEAVAPVYMRLERYDDAVKARRQLLSLLGPTAVREVDLGEALAAAANGVVGDEAKAAFDRAAALDPENVKAQFYLGLAAEQSGDAGGAARIWRELIAKAPAGAPWLAVVREQLVRVDATAAAPGAMAPAASAPAAQPPGPRPDDIAAAGEMTDEQRSQMIRGMVDRLATRLHENGSDLDGWLRLLRAYKVMGEHAKAKSAAAEARTALTNEPEKLRRLDAAIKELGIGG